jgi:uncharacterized repeat protein (TIGR01451 family)
VLALSLATGVSGSARATTGAAELSVAITDDSHPVGAGQELIYTATATNVGSAPASPGALTVETPFPPTAVSDSACRMVPTGVACDVVGLGVGDRYSVQVTVVTPAVGAVTATASGFFNNPDDDPSDNLAVIETPVVDPLVDLQIAGSVNGADVGGTLAFDATIFNPGPIKATGVVVTDTLPAGVTFVAAGASQGTCDGTTCRLGTLAAGGSATVTITAIAGVAGPISNTAEVHAAELDVNPFDNVATADGVVGPTGGPAADGQITIIQAGDPPSGFHTKNLPATIFRLGAGEQRDFTGLAPGPYTVAQDRLAGWTLDGLECSDPTQDTRIRLDTRRALINLAAGEHVVCTFHDARQG